MQISAEGNIEAVMMLGNTPESLAEQINILNNEIGRFRIKLLGFSEVSSCLDHVRLFRLRPLFSLWMLHIPASV